VSWEVTGLDAKGVCARVAEHVLKLVVKLNFFFFFAEALDK
jgi:hypothetical protein